MSITEQQEVALEFFEYLFAQDTGFVCISTAKQGDKRTFQDTYFEWPKQQNAILEYIDRTYGLLNVWFGVNLLSVPKRKKENCIPQNLVWADLDACRPDRLEIPPTCVIESSPRRYQAIWRLDQKIDPFLAEDFSRRIAYEYAQYGADKSGHDLTQLLRVPGTLNFKYELNGDLPAVELLVKRKELLPVALFESIPRPEDSPDFEKIIGVPMPDLDTLHSPTSLITQYGDNLKTTAFARYYGDEPNEDWSKSLWRLINTCIEAGMTAEETFVVVRSAKCNKYARDNRPETHLWREILKAELQHKSLSELIEEVKPFSMPLLLTDKEREQTGNTIIQDYKQWAIEATDAAPEYHELCCAILLSALIADGLRLETSHTTYVPNLWALLLGDSTLTRKTTAMEMAMKFVQDIDPEIVVATDGSPEGLLTELNNRPRMASVFYRDEVTGFFEAVQKKEYMATMPEVLAKLYDVPSFFKKTLRRETINVTEPVFIFFGGGIREKTFFLLDEQHFLSGFVPRFLVVNGYVDRDRIRRTGPPSQRLNLDKREQLRETFSILHQMYTQAVTEIEIEGLGQVMPTKRLVHADMNDDAWEKYQTIEQILEDAGDESPYRERALPCFDRLSKSLLKLAVLLAAARQTPNEDFRIEVAKQDICESAALIEKWGRHLVELIKQAGLGKDETKIQSVYRQIERRPGIQRSAVMQYHHFNARQMEEVEETLEQRLMIQVQKKGKAKLYWPIGR